MHIDYNNSLLSLVSSVLKHYKIDTAHPTLPEVDKLLKGNYKNVVIMLFDGMGTAILEKHLPPDSFLRSHYEATILAVFPPTTTAATVTMESGLSPIEHGWLGWSLYFDEVGENVNIFPNTISGTEIPAAGFSVAGQYIPYTDIFEKINKQTGVTAHRVSPFSSYHSKSVSEICDTVKALCNENGNKYIYTYWHQPDYDMHDYGTMHEKITEDITEINRLVEDMCGELSDTLVIVTADHGLVDTEWRLLADYPEIGECLLRKPSVESRALTFFIKEGKNEQFEAAFQKHFGDIYSLFSKEQVINNKFFGDGIPNKRSYGFIGDYLAVATGNVSIESTMSNIHDLFKAAHAGMTADELSVPLIAVKCK